MDGTSSESPGAQAAATVGQGSSDSETAALEAFERSFEAPLPQQIGHYRVLRLIGQGGMGAVYEAEQQQPRRKVALKVIRAGLLSREMLRRFTFEVEMLGRLRHPGIAQIHEAGTAQTDAGVQPYFAMEYVDGRPLGKHAADLDTRAKLGLLARIADAVHYAHQNGIIHRDLKPDNILVDEHGQPKVLDFGVARSTNADMQATMQTETGAIIGTLSYMSPEQAAGEAHHVDVRSDVYALGVIGYQLLCGQLPYDLPRQSLVTALRVIREVDVVPIGRTHKDLRGDVETILAKALEKEKERRYQSSHDFATDIRRHLNDEPISARPADTMYQLQKFVRRNRALVGGIAATFLVLVVGLLATAWQWRDAVEHRKLAEDNGREMKVRLIGSLVAQGDALALAGRPADAKAKHQEALVLAEAAGESLLPAQFGFWEDRRHSPEALAVWTASAAPRALAFSPDGRRALSGGGIVRYWDVGRGTVIHEINLGEMRGGHSVKFSPDGQLAAVGTGMGRLLLWNLATGQIDWTTPAHGAPVTAIAFEQGAGTIVSAALDRSVAILDSASGRLLRRFGDEPGGFPADWKKEGAAAISPDGGFVAVADEAGNLWMWRSADGTLLQERRAHEGTIHGLSFTPDSRQLITASADKTLALWNVDDGARVRTFVGHGNGVASISVSPDGARMLSGSWDKTVTLWDLSTGEVLRTFTGHSGEFVAPRAVAFSPDMTLALSAANDDTVRLWNLRPERQVRSLVPANANPADEPARVTAIHLSPDGRLLVSSSNDGALRLWDVATGLPLGTIAAHASAGGSSGVVFLPDGKQLLSAGASDGLLKLWNLYGTSSDRADLAQPSASMPIDGRVGALAVSPDGRLALAGGSVGTVCVFDLATGEHVRTHGVPDPNRAVFGLSFSPEGARALAVFQDSTLEVWDPSTGASRGQVSRSGGFHNVDSAHFQPGDSKLIAAGGWSGVPRLWDAAPPYAEHPEFPLASGHGSTILDLNFTADGRFVITAGWDNTVRIWDVQRHELIRALADHALPVVSVDTSADGELAASGSWDGSVKLWELSSVTDFAEQRDAAAKAARSLQRKPNDSAAMLVLGDWYARRGAETLAIQMLDQAAQAGARISQLQLARCFVALGRWDEARRAFGLARLSSEAPAQYIELCLAALPDRSEVHPQSRD